MAQRIRIYENGAPDVLRYERYDVGRPEPGEVRLRQTAIGVNFVDTMFRDGTFATKLPLTIGCEGVGVVEDIGEGVSGIQLGARVGYYYALGAYASERLIAAEELIPIPIDISSDQAATFLAKGLTAWMGVKGLTEIGPGQVVLVQGATGAAASLVARWAKHLGAKVIGTTGNPERVVTLGEYVDRALFTGDPSFQDIVREIAPSGVDIVHEFVGRATLQLSVDALKDGGLLLTIGAASGAGVVDSGEAEKRRIRVAGDSMVRHVRQGRQARAIGDVFAAIRSGVFAGTETRIYSLEGARLAHEDIQLRRFAGPAILAPTPSH